VTDGLAENIGPASAGSMFQPVPPAVCVDDHRESLRQFEPRASRRWNRSSNRPALQFAEHRLRELRRRVHDVEWCQLYRDDRS